MKKEVTFRSHARQKGPSQWKVRLMALAFAVFVAGGLYFGYVFVSTAIELIELQTGVDLPNPPGPVVASSNPNPAKSSGSVTTQPRPGDRINILLLGLDQRPVESGEPSRSDTIMIASLEPRTQSAALLSIPRDLWVAIPQNDGEIMYHKITTAHFFGQYWNQLEGINADGGPDLAKRTVEYNFGIPIHYYARIDFKGFEKAVDLIGGLDIDVPYEIVDTAYPLENDTGVTTIRFEPGIQHMDGMTALRYARTRHADSDFGAHGAPAPGTDGLPRPGAQPRPHPQAAAANRGDARLVRLRHSVRSDAGPGQPGAQRRPGQDRDGGDHPRDGRARRADRRSAAAQAGRDPAASKRGCSSTPPSRKRRPRSSCRTARRPTGWPAAPPNASKRAASRSPTCAKRQAATTRKPRSSSTQIRTTRPGDWQPCCTCRSRG